MAEPRRYRSDDRDLEDHDLDLVVLPPDGNGDWYVSVLPHGDKIGPTVRVTTSGTPNGQHGVCVAVARLYRAMGGEEMTCSNCANLDSLLFMEGVHAPSVAEGIEKLGEERDAAVERARALFKELEQTKRALLEMTLDRNRLAREVEEADIDGVLHALRGAPESVEVEPGGYRAMSVGERVRWLADIAFGLTLGDLINARARAGAAKVEAEQTEERARVALKHAHGRDRIAAARTVLAAAEQRRTRATAAYETARRAEQAASG